MDSAENVQTIPGMACLFDPVKSSQREQRKERRKENHVAVQSSEVDLEA